MKNKKNRFVGIISVLLLFGFVTTSFVSYYVAHNSLMNQIADTTLPLTSDNIYSEIQRDLLRPIFISSLMAQDTFLRDWILDGEQDEKAIIRYLNQIQKRYATITSFLVSEKTHKYYHSSGVLKKISQEDPQDKWYYRVQKIQEDYEVNLDIDTADMQSLTIFVNYRVYDYSGRYIGATGVGLAVKAVGDMIDTYQNRYGRRIYFTDREGRITLRGSKYSGPENIREVSKLAKIATQILTSPSTSLTYEDNSKTVYINSRLVPEFGWYLLVEQVGDPSQKLILNTLMGNIALSLIITMVVMLLAYLTIGGYQRRLEEMATTDKLTGLANRHVFDMLFDQALKYSRRKDGKLSALMFDVDHFKNVNDTHGHPAGDSVLNALADAVRTQIRDSDILFRWGGEEFLLLLPDCDLNQAVKIAEKIRSAINNRASVTYGGREIFITVSLGVGQLLTGEDRVNLVRRVDEALYKAKANGRNRVEYYENYNLTK